MGRGSFGKTIITIYELIVLDTYMWRGVNRGGSTWRDTLHAKDTWVEYGTTFITKIIACALEEPGWYHVV